MVIVSCFAGTIPTSTMGADSTVSSWFGITPLASGLHGREVPGRPSGHISRIHK